MALERLNRLLFLVLSIAALDAASELTGPRFPAKAATEASGIRRAAAAIRPKPAAGAQTSCFEAKHGPPASNPCESAISSLQSDGGSPVSGGSRFDRLTFRVEMSLPISNVSPIGKVRRSAARRGMSKEACLSAAARPERATPARRARTPSAAPKRSKNGGRGQTQRPHWPRRLCPGVSGHAPERCVPSVREGARER